jgi:hypothetical protein
MELLREERRIDHEIFDLEAEYKDALTEEEIPSWTDPNVDAEMKWRELSGNLKSIIAKKKISSAKRAKKRITRRIAVRVNKNETYGVKV